MYVAFLGTGQCDSSSNSYEGLAWIGGFSLWFLTIYILMRIARNQSLGKIRIFALQAAVFIVAVTCTLMLIGWASVGLSC